MSWKSFACVAALSFAVAPAFAVPSLAFIDNGDSTGTFTLTPDPALFPTVAGGSLAFEIDITVTGGAIESGGTTGNGPLFPTANPGMINGSNFVGLEIDGTTIRGAFGSDLFTTGDAVDAFIVDLDGAGSLTYDADFAQDGTAFSQSGSGSITNASLVAGDFNQDGQVDNGDLNLLLGAWGDPGVPAEWTAPFTSPVDNDELNDLLGNWGFGTSVAVPEPASALILAVAGVALAGARRNG